MFSYLVVHTNVPWSPGKNSTVKWSSVLSSISLLFLSSKYWAVYVLSSVTSFIVGVRHLNLYHSFVGFAGLIISLATVP